MDRMLVLAVLLCASIAFSSACSCFPHSGPDRFCKYDLIFRGMAVAEYEEREDPIDHSDPHWEFNPFRDWVYTVRVDQAIHMPPSLENVTSISLRTSMQGNLCGVRFALDMDAVFFARINQEKGEIETGLCDPNTPWSVLSDWEKELLTDHVVDYCSSKDSSEEGMPPLP